MRFGCVFLLLAAVASAQQLRVKEASTHSTLLEWDGSAAGWTVERKTEGGTYEKIGTAQTGTFEDSKIQPYATYRYRVSAATGAKSSLGFSPCWWLIVEHPLRDPIATAVPSVCRVARQSLCQRTVTIGRQ